MWWYVVKLLHFWLFILWGLVGIKPFVLHTMPEEMAHLCPVRAYVDWLNATSITQGYIFRKIDTRDWVLEKNEPMVFFLSCFSFQKSHISNYDRQRNASWRYSGTTFLISRLIPSPMAHTLSDVEAANGWLWSFAGLCVAFVSGVAGAQSFHT